MEAEAASAEGYSGGAGDYNGTFNASANGTQVEREGGDGESAQRYQVVVPLLLLLCIASLAVNVYVLAAVRWIRRPLSRTLRLSVSLAAADALSSLCLGVGLFVNSLLTHGLMLSFDTCLLLGLEVLRMGAVVSTALHLVALAVHHYLGIRRPLQSPPSRHALHAALALLWIAPFAFFGVYYASIEGQGFQHANCTSPFLLQFEFRATQVCMVVVPLALLIFFYAHIFVLVRRVQEGRAALAPTHRSFRASTRASTGSSASGAVAQAGQQQLARNMKAVRTTLLIVGSCVLGWVPGLAAYLLVCDDCLYKNRKSEAMFGIYAVTNLLVIAKTLANPIIYGARMNEIKMAQQRMHASFRRRCCCGAWTRRGRGGRAGDTFDGYNSSSFGGGGGVGRAGSITLTQWCRARSTRTSATANGPPGCKAPLANGSQDQRTASQRHRITADKGGKLAVGSEDL